MELFLKQGYESTTMQDIVKALGMSKGAIFHHFSSKEEIFDVSMSGHFDNQLKVFKQWEKELEGLNAKDKIQQLLKRNFEQYQELALERLLIAIVKSPTLSMKVMQENVNKLFIYLADLFREGMIDGSITTPYPDECAQTFLLIFNEWCDPMLFPCDFKQVKKRLEYVQSLMKLQGADILSDEIILLYLTLLKQLEKSSCLLLE